MVNKQLKHILNNMILNSQCFPFTHDWGEVYYCTEIYKHYALRMCKKCRKVSKRKLSDDVTRESIKKLHEEIDKLNES